MPGSMSSRTRGCDAGTFLPQAYRCCGAVSLSRLCSCVACVQGDAAKISYIAMPILSKVLEQMAPKDFQSYAEFRASCSSLNSSIGHIAERLTSLPPCLACKVDNNSKTVHVHMARVRGCLRRVLEPEERFFNAAEYAGVWHTPNSPGRAWGMPSLACLALVELGYLQAAHQDTVNA